MLARLAEPVLWTATLLHIVDAGDPERAAAILPCLAVFLPLRLIADTAPNLVASGRIEAAPYDDRLIRRALARVKLTLALALALALQLIIALAPVGSGLASIDATLAGSGGPLFWFALALTSYSLASPAVREHRGVPVARPSLAPAVAAGSALAIACLTHLDGPGLARRFLLLIAAANLVVGLLQRYLAASRRLHHPLFTYAYAEVNPSTRSQAWEEAVLIRAALKTAPFLLLPIWPAVFAALARTTPPWLAVAIMPLAGLPPLLYDAKRNSPRFRIASLIAAIGLLSLWRAAPGLPSPCVETALLVLAYPAASRLIESGFAGTVGRAVLLLLLARPLLHAIAPALAWPVAELLTCFFVTVAAASCGPADDRYTDRRS